MNAKRELLQKIDNIDKKIEDVDWLEISLPYYEHKKYTKIEELDIEYNNDFGTQHLYGSVVFKDGTWLERGEYDGSEWWEYKQVPTKDWDNDESV